MPDNINMNAIAMRPEIQIYFNLGTEAVPSWKRCGNGWIKFAENPNAQTESVLYINQSSESKDTVSYSPEYSVEADLLYNDPTVKLVYGIAKDRKTGSDATIDVVIADAFDKLENGACVARRERLSVAITSLDGQKKMKMTGSLNGQGDGVKGSFNIESLTFTPEGETTEG